MDLGEFIERVLDGAVVPVAAPAEGDYHAAWLQHEVGSEDPFLMAALGGALADRLAWVFMAGHQGTVRHCFPRLPAEPGWSAFVNSEDPTGDLPGTALTGGPGAWRLSGAKTWVAGADHIDRLLVSARHNEVPFIVLRRATPGVHIESGEPKTYLSELVQGRVTFENVAVSEEQLTGDERTFTIFRFTEPAYVRVALNGFILSHARRLEAPAWLVGGAVAGLYSAAVILYLRPPLRSAALGLLGMDTNTRWLASEFEAFIRTRDEALHRLWTKDSHLVEASTSAIAARAEAALRLASS
jgi:alkylation response protein AidB-like acyl-CoA dehydrogenase